MCRLAEFHVIALGKIVDLIRGVREMLYRDDKANGKEIRIFVNTVISLVILLTAVGEIHRI
jgi:hypothetical protein